MLGPRLGVFLLVDVIFAVFVCALAVHAGIGPADVRHGARQQPAVCPLRWRTSRPRTQAPIVPSVVVGVLAAALLVVNINLPHVIETLCSVAIVWANLAYLLVTLPLLLTRLRRNASRQPCPSARCENLPVTVTGSRVAAHPFLAGPMGTAGQRDRGRSGASSSSSTSAGRVRRSTAPALGPVRGAARHARPDRPGALYYLLFQRKRTGILAEHAAEPIWTIHGAHATASPRSVASGQ